MGDRRGKQRRGREGRTNKKAVEECHERFQLDQHGERVTRSTKLALLASRDAGKQKVGLQLVMFVNGALLSIIQEYEATKAAVLIGTAAKGLKLKNCIYHKIRSPSRASSIGSTYRSGSVATDRQDECLPGRPS